MTGSPFRYFKTSPEIISLAVMMYTRFPLSLRKVEDLLQNVRERQFTAMSGLIRREEATGNLRAPRPLATSLQARRSRARFRLRAPRRLATGFVPCGQGPGCVCAIPAWLLGMAASMPYWCQGPQERARTSFALDLARSPTAALAPARLVPIDAAPSRVAS